MVSIPKQLPVTAGEMPFASYAQVVRMLMPLVRKVSFHNASGRALWISDGIEEPDLRMHIEVLLERCAVAHASRTVPDHGTSTDAEPVHVLPVCAANGEIAGSLCIAFGELPAAAAYRQFRTIERLLTPLMQILAYSWEPKPPAAPARPAAATVTPVPVSNSTPPEPTLIPIPKAVANDDSDESDAMDGVESPRLPLLALLRRTLAGATEQLGCAFGTVVTPNRPFTLSHRISTEESDLAIDSAIEAVRAHMLRLMAVRNEPLILNNIAPGRTQFGSYKLLALPLRLAGCGPLIALIVLFRNWHARDFTSADVDSLMLSALHIPDESLAEFAPEPITAPTPATMRAPAVPAASTPSAVAPASTAVVVTSTPRTPATSSIKPPVLRTVVYETLPAAPPASMTMDMRVRSALRDDKFNLYVQSISPLRNEQRPARFEVLLRMHDSQTILAPPAFFGAAAASSLMPDVDRWVIRNVLAKLHENASAVRSGHWEFCINLAAQSLTADRFSEFVIAEVCRSAIPADLLVFEISEASAFEHQHALEHFGARVRDVGCRIALDNCREGLGTFGVMHRWPVSCVKIDGSVIRNVLNSPRSASMVRDVARHAAARGIETVAECVEAAGVRDKLLDIGIDYAQGFHYGQPRPIATLFA